VARLHSRLLVPTVLRPIAEHLAALAQPAADDVCVDIGCDSAVMAALLGRTARRFIAVDDDVDVLADVREELSMLHLDGGVALLRARSDALPLRDGCAQVVTSLFAQAQHRDPIGALRQMLRILDPQRGRLVCALWTDAAGQTTPIAGRRLDTATLVKATGGRAHIEVVRDVARFDGVAHYRATLPGRDTEQEALEPWTAHDGTLRIPTETVVLAVSPGR
jgi:SAM-dependent methyltransferase